MTVSTTPRTFMVEVHADLLAELGDWSRPLQARIEPDTNERGGYRMTFRIPEPEVIPDIGTRERR